MALCSGNKHINKIQRKICLSVFLFNAYLGDKRNIIPIFEENIQMFPVSPIAHQGICIINY